MLGLQGTTVLEQTVVVSVRVERLEYVVCYTPDDGVDLEPVVQGFVLILVKVLYAFVLDGLEL